MPSQKSLLIMFRALLFYCSTTLLFILVAAFVPLTGFRPVSLITMGCSAGFSFILLVVFCRWDAIPLKAAGISFSRKNSAYFLTGFITGLVLVIAWIVLTLLLTPYRLSLNRTPDIKAILSALLLFLFVAVREELVYRSYFLRRLTTAYNALIALLIVTTVFILEHRAAGISWKTSVIGSGLGGILFGIAALKTKGIALPVGLHSAWNLGRWVFGLTENTGFWHYTNTYGNDIRDEAATLATYAIIMFIAISCFGLLPAHYLNKIHWSNYSRKRVQL